MSGQYRLALVLPSTYRVQLGRHDGPAGDCFTSVDFALQCGPGFMRLRHQPIRSRRPPVSAQRAIPETARSHPGPIWQFFVARDASSSKLRARGVSPIAWQEEQRAVQGIRHDATAGGSSSKLLSGGFLAVSKSQCLLRHLPPLSHPFMRSTSGPLPQVREALLLRPSTGGQFPVLALSLLLPSPQSE